MRREYDYPSLALEYMATHHMVIVLPNEGVDLDLSLFTEHLPRPEDLAKVDASFQNGPMIRQLVLLTSAKLLELSDSQVPKFVLENVAVSKLVTRGNVRFWPFQRKVQQKVV